MIRLVIVESPSKAKTIAGYLGPDYFVEASFGHVRDLPRNAADVPAKYKGEAWARLGVDVDNGFHALYVVSQDRKAQIAKLQKLAKEVDGILRLPEVTAKIETLGLQVEGGTPEEFQNVVRTDAAVYARIIKEANIRLTP